MKLLPSMAALCVLASIWSCQKPASEILKPQIKSSPAAVQADFLSETTTTSTNPITYSKVAIDNYGICNMITYTPAGAGAAAKRPVIVFTPGNGEVGTDSSKIYVHGPLHFIKNGWRPDFVVVGIQPLYGCDSRSPRFAHAMLTAIRQNPLVDTNQVYMTGLSGGAFTTLRYIRDYPTPYHVRAIMVFSMSMASKCTESLCGNDLRFKNVHAWGMCGDIDTRFEPGMKSYFNMLIGTGFTAQYNEYSGGHGGWNTYYNPTWTRNGYSIYSWMLKWGAATCRSIRVNVTNSSHLSTTWNNLVDTASVLKFTDGATSGVTARLSHKVSVADNGSTYATTGTNMAPSEVLRFSSYDTLARTLTLYNLNPAKTYNLELYASRCKNSTEQTIFIIGTEGSVTTYNNLSNKVQFQNLVPDAYNRIVVQLKSAVAYNYLNGFTLTEVTK